jgi:beta-lactam-binding protein with PASTA domain
MAKPPSSTDETLIDPEWTPGPETRVVVEDREPPPPPRRRLPRVWPWLLALLLLVLAGVGAAFYFSQDDDEPAATTTQAAARVEVPRVVGLREPRAVGVLREAGLQADVARHAANRTAGIVLEQEPQDGVRVAEGEDVRLVVSQGPARETVPDLVGAELNDALADLKAAGVDAQVRQVFADKPSGVVVKQEPAPGTKLEEGAVVVLQVSKGSKAVPVPDMVGQQASEATAALREAGFEVNIVTVPSQQPSGSVVAQNPPGGTSAETGTTVRLNVAQRGGPGTTTTGTTTTGTTTGQTTTPARPPAGPATVPDVVAMTQAQATKALHDAGLKPSLSFVPSEQYLEGTVVAQAKEPGTTLRRGDSVGVNVSVGPEQVSLVPVPNVEGAEEQDARSRLEADGFRVQVLREVTDDPAKVGVVVDQQPGRVAPEGALVTIYVGRR